MRNSNFIMLSAYVNTTCIDMWLFLFQNATNTAGDTLDIIQFIHLML